MSDTPESNNPQPRAPRSAANRGFILLAVAALVALVAWEQFMPVKSAVAWGKDLPAAIETAQAQDRPLLLSFSSPACMYCRQMESEVFPQEEVLAEIDHFVPVKIDASEDYETSVRYNVNPLPTYIVADSSGKAVTRLEGYVPADRFIRFLQAGRRAATPAAQ